MYIAKTGNLTCPYTYLIKYLEVAGIPPFSQDYIFRSLRYDKETKGNVLSSKPLSTGRAGEILRRLLEWNPLGLVITPLGLDELLQLLI